MKKLKTIMAKPDSANFNSIALGETVRLLREKLHLTQADLGELSNLSTAEISKLENGNRKKIPLETLIRISPHLNVSIDYLLASCLLSYQNDRERFYDYAGMELDLYKVAKNLYSVDAGLLILLSSPEFLSDRETVKFIKSWIELSSSVHKNPSASGFAEKLLLELRNYCSQFLETIGLYQNNQVISK